MSTYDENGNKVGQVMPDGTNKESWFYNQFGQMVKFTDFDGNQAVYTYANSGTQAGLLQSVAYRTPALVGTSATSESEKSMGTRTFDDRSAENRADEAA